MGASHISGPLYVGGVPVGNWNLPAGPDSKVFYVDPTYGSDGRSGSSWEKAFASVEAGYAALRTNRHDVLVLGGNAGHTLEDELLITKNRIHIISADPTPRYYGQSTRINLGVTTGSAKAAINNQGVRNSFHGLKITSSDTLAASLYGVVEAGEFSYWECCEILKTTDLDQATAAELLHNGDSCVFRHCAIGNMIYQPSAARQNVLFTRETITGKVARDVIFDDVIFMNFPDATTVVNLRATTNDIERLARFRGCLFASKPGGSTQALVAGIASALTDGRIILEGCTVDNITNVCATGLGVVTNSAQPVADATETVSVALT